MSENKMTFWTLAAAGIREYPDMDVPTLAERIVAVLTKDQLRSLIVVQLIDEINEIRWQQDRRAQMNAMNSDPEMRAARAIERRGAKAYKAALDDRCQLLRDDPDAYNAKYGIGRIIDRWREEMRLEITAELLGMTFVLDGRRMTMGEATLEDHERRMTRLVGGMGGMSATYRLHEAAVKLILTRRVTCLADLSEAAA